MIQPRSFLGRSFGLVFSIILATLASNLIAADDAWLESVEAAYARLDAKLNNFSVRAQFFNTEHPPGKPPSERRLLFVYTFSRLGNLAKSAQEGATSGDPTTDSVANESYFFTVGNNSPGQSADLFDLGERAELNFSNVSRRKAARELLSAATGPMGSFGFPLESPLRVLKHNAPKLLAQEISWEGRTVLLLEGDFERFTNGESMSDTDRRAYSAPNSRIFLDPSLNYRIVRWETKLVAKGKSYLYTDTYEYDHTVDGYPLLSRYKSEIGAPVPYTTQEIIFSDWRLNINKPDEFRLPHYGLKEPNYGKKPFLGGWAWLVLIGAALITIGGWLYRRARS